MEFILHKYDIILKYLTLQSVSFDCLFSIYFEAKNAYLYTICPAFEYNFPYFEKRSKDGRTV